MVVTRNPCCKRRLIRITVWNKSPQDLDLETNVQLEHILPWRWMEKITVLRSSRLGWHEADRIGCKFYNMMCLGIITMKNVTALIVLMYQCPITLYIDVCKFSKTTLNTHTHSFAAPYSTSYLKSDSTLQNPCLFLSKKDRHRILRLHCHKSH